MAKSTRTGAPARTAAAKRKAVAKPPQGKVAKAGAKNVDDLKRILTNFVQYAPKALLK
jgi:hypothetical protein